MKTPNSKEDLKKILRASMKAAAVSAIGNLASLAVMGNLKVPKVDLERKRSPSM